MRLLAMKYNILPQPTIMKLILVNMKETDLSLYPSIMKQLKQI